MSEEQEKKEKKKWIRSLLFLLRDLGIAALIVGIILLSLFLYTSNWPPMVVVESRSMQHSDTESFIGTIDTGDLVLVQRTPSSGDIITYVEGRVEGHGTYGDYGDVIIYKEGGDFQDKSIIHRALIRLVLNESGESIDVPDLDSPKWELGGDWSGKNLGGEQVTSPYGLNNTLTLYGVGHAHRNVTLSIGNYLDEFQARGWNDSAFVAMGDNNRMPDPHAVRLEWIVGKARGEIPWFGLLKLTLFRDPGAPCCASWGDPYAAKNSWDSLLISIVLIVALPIALDFGISYALEVRRRRAKAAAEGSSEVAVEAHHPEVSETEPPLEEAEEMEVEGEAPEELQPLEEKQEEVPEKLPEDQEADEDSAEREPNSDEDLDEGGLES
ncbi:MAG: S26 family signal peptidase [Thermoplasmata archaeon]